MTGRVVPTPMALADQPEPDLAAFVGLVGLVLTGFLVLARLSQQVVDDAESDAPGHQHPRRTSEVASASDGVSDPVESDRRGAYGETATGSDEPTRVDRAEHPTPDRAERPAVDSARTSADDPLANDRKTLERTEREPTRPRQDTADGGDPGMSPGLLLLNVALTQGLFGVVLAAGAWYFGVPLDALGVSSDALSTGLPALAVGVGFGLVLWVGNEVASGLAKVSGADYDEGLRELLAPAGVRGWVILLGGTLPVIAVVEEFIFRAAVIGATTAAFDTSAWALAVVSSAAFALGHGAQGRVGVVVTGTLGFALAAGFILTDSLLVVVVAHYLVNALEFAAHEGLGLPDPIWASARSDDGS